jgi:hypothetical protein
MLLTFHRHNQFSVERGFSGKYDFNWSNEKIIPYIWVTFRLEHGYFPFLCGLSLNDVDCVELYVIGSFGVQ